MPTPPVFHVAVGFHNKRATSARQSLDSGGGGGELHDLWKCTKNTHSRRVSAGLEKHLGGETNLRLTKKTFSTSVLPSNKKGFRRRYYHTMNKKKRLHRRYRTEYHIPRYKLTVSRHAVNHGILRSAVAQKGRSLFRVRMTMTNGNPDRQIRHLKEPNYSRDARRQKLQPNLAPGGVKSVCTCTVGSSFCSFPPKIKRFCVDPIDNPTVPRVRGFAKCA